MKDRFPKHIKIRFCTSVDRKNCIQVERMKSESKIIRKLYFLNVIDYFLKKNKENFKAFNFNYYLKL